MENKVAKHFSKPLMKQNIKSNFALIIAIAVIMIMMSTVLNYAMSIMGGLTAKEDTSDTQKDFFTYLGAMANLNAMSGTQLSYEDYVSAEDKTLYETMFAIVNSQADMNLSCENFDEIIADMEKSDVAIQTYIRQFEYNYVLMQNQGCFTGNELTLEEMMNVMFEMMGIDAERMEMLTEMDPTAMLNQMYYTVIGLLPPLILIVFLANALVVDQVDRGSMAYVLSTPTKRSAVMGTQITFMLAVPFIVITLVCISRIITTNLFFDEVNVKGLIALFVGMYILIEAIASICFMGSCIFNRSRSALAFGGGISVWFFLASLLGMFGTDMMIDMGIGLEELGYFNKATLIGLYDINALATVGTDYVDDGFAWKLAVLAAIAFSCYWAGAVRFQKKDLPL